MSPRCGTSSVTTYQQMALDTNKKHTTLPQSHTHVQRHTLHVRCQRMKQGCVGMLEIICNYWHQIPPQFKTFSVESLINVQEVTNIWTYRSRTSLNFKHIASSSNSLLKPTPAVSPKQPSIHPVYWLNLEALCSIGANFINLFKSWLFMISLTWIWKYFLIGALDSILLSCMILINKWYTSPVTEPAVTFQPE